MTLRQEQQASSSADLPCRSAALGETISDGHPRATHVYCPTRRGVSGAAFGPRSAQIDAMSRLRRPFLSDRYIFATVKVRKPRRRLGQGDFKRLASAMSRMRPKHRFLLAAWVFLPDHGHAISTYHFPSDESKVAPTSCSSKSAAFSEDEPQSFSKSKLCATSFNQGRREAGEFWQGRFFDCAFPGSRRRSCGRASQPQYKRNYRPRMARCGAAQI